MSLSASSVAETKKAATTACPSKSTRSPSRPPGSSPELCVIVCMAMVLFLSVSISVFGDAFALDRLIVTMDEIKLTAKVAGNESLSALVDEEESMGLEEVVVVVVGNDTRINTTSTNSNSNSNNNNNSASLRGRR